MKIKWWIILIFLIPLVLIGWWAMTFFTKPKQTGEKLFYKVKKGNISITVKETGEFAPKEVTQLTPFDLFNTDAKGLIGTSWRAPVHQFTIKQITPKGKVNKDALLVEFDNTIFNNSFEQTKNNMTTNRQNYVNVLNDLSVKISDLGLNIKSSEVALKEARKNFDSIWCDVEQGKISEDDLGYQRLRVALEQADYNLEKLRREYKIVNIVLRYYTIDIDKGLQERRKSRKLNASSFPNSDTISKTAITLTNTAPISKTIVVSIIPQYPEELKGEPQVLLSRHLTPIINALKAIEDTDKSLELLELYPQPTIALYAPITGFLFYGSPPGQHGWAVPESEVRVGKQCWIEEPLLYISNSIDMKVILKVDEINIGKVKTGYKVKITPQAITDLVLSGKVEEIAETPEDKQDTKALGKYSITILVDGSDERLKPKMSVKVEIICEEIKDVIYVPLEAVFEKDNKKICYVLSILDGQTKPIEREVKTAKSNDDFIVITEGLKEQEEVYLYDPFLKK